MPLKPIAKIAGLQGEAERAVREQINALIRRVEELSGSARVTTLKRSNYLASDGEYVRTIGGLNHTLPRARLENQGAEITFFIESAGTTRFTASGSTINGASSVQVTGARRVTFQSNGDGGWLGDEGESVAAAVAAAASGPTDAPADATYHLQTADADLPNARVGTDSTEIDVDYTVAAVVSWALRTASVAFSKLANLTGLSVLGRASSSAGVMAAITAGANNQVLRRTSDTLNFGPVTNASLDADVTWAATLARGNNSDEYPVLIYTQAPFSSYLGFGDEAFYPVTGDIRAVNLNVQVGEALNIAGLESVSIGTDTGLTRVLALSANLINLTVQETSGGRVRTPGPFVMGEMSSISYSVQAGEGAIWCKNNAPTTPMWTDDASSDFDIALGVSSTSITWDATTRTFRRAALTGDVTASANSNSTTIANDAVTNAKLRNSGACSVIGRSANSSGDPADIAASANNQVLRRVSNSLSFGAVPNAALDTDVTWAAVLARGRTSGSANPHILTGQYLEYGAGSLPPSGSIRAAETFVVRSSDDVRLVAANEVSLAADTISLAADSIELDAAAAGGVVSMLVGTGDALINGAPIRVRSSRIQYWQEDFDFVNTIVVTAGSTSLIACGNTNWFAGATGTGNATTSEAVGSAGHVGVIRLITGSTNQDRILFYRGGIVANAYIGSHVRRFDWVMRMPSTANIVVQFGLWDTLTAGSETSYVIFSYVNTGGVASNWFGLTNEAGATESNDSGVQADTNWHSYVLAQETLGTVDYYIDDVLEVIESISVPDAESLRFGVRVQTRTGAQKEVELDYVDFETHALARF
jgi:hypothetical protein